MKASNPTSLLSFSQFLTVSNRVKLQLATALMGAALPTASVSRNKKVSHFPASCVRRSGKVATFLATLLIFAGVAGFPLHAESDLQRKYAKLKSSQVLTKAEKGDADAQYEMGFRFARGHRDEIKQDKTEAARWYRLAAEGGSVLGMHDLGYVLSTGGEGVDLNPEEAFEWFSKASAAGDADSKVRLASFYRYGGVVEQDLSKAAQLFLEAAKQGHERAPDYILAMHNRKEYEFPPEDIFKITKTAAEDKPPRKMEFGMRAAESGDPVAQRLLGDLYKDGIGTQRNLSAAVKWYRKAAEAGDIRAQVCLATMYETGQGTAKSPAQAFKWFYKAATSTNAADGSKQSRLHFLNEGPEESTVDPSILAAEKSGRMLINGEGTKKDTEAGIQLLEKAANCGQLEAMHLLGVIFSSGQGIKKDHELGVEWHRKAAAEGHQASIDTLVALGIEN